MIDSSLTSAVHPALILVGLLAATGHAQIEFHEVAGARGIGPYDAGPGFGAGLAVADYDDDGDLDLYVPTGAGTPNLLYRNRGDGHFEEVAADVGLASLAPGRTALWLDVDGDGRLDLVVAGDCFNGAEGCVEASWIHVFQQRPDGIFDDVTTDMGMDDDGVTGAGQHRSGLVADDLDGDGWVDLVVGLWAGPARVWRNDEGHGFIDVSDATGFADASSHHWQPTIHDFDEDGHPDLYWAIDFAANRLWHNQGDGTFVDLAHALGVDNDMNDMGLSLGDIDGDGDFDLYVTEIFEFENHNVLYRNDTVDGRLAFTEIAVAAGVADTGFGWGSTFFDADNDGWLDLAATNGWFNGIGYDDPSRLFFSLGTDPPTFEDRATEVGFDDRAWGVSLVAFDMDRDGDLDIAQTCNPGPVRLLENEPLRAAAAHHHVVVQPRTNGPNRFGIGAIVRVDAGNLHLTRRISAGTGHLGQEPPEAFFGLGDHPHVDRLVVDWPDGARTVRTGIDANQILTITRSPCPGTADLDGDGIHDFRDLVLLLANWGPCPTRCPEDVNADGQADVADVLELFARWGPCE